MHMIGVIGRSGSGKTTAAALMAAELIDQGITAKLEAFAVPIKERIRRDKGRHIRKDEDRAFMQGFGASIRSGDPALFIKDLIRRNNMDAHLWEHFADKWEPADVVIVTDVRYENEADFCRSHGILVFVEGSRKPLAGEEALHESETFAARVIPSDVDYVIHELSDLELLAKEARKIVESFLGKTFVITQKKELD